MARLRRSDCTGPGIRRRGRGRGFEFLDEGGERITDADTLSRLAELRVPPAWRDVWICSDPMGHLQATGVDAAGRKQYLYHQRWRERRDQEKFDRMLDFARALPRMRRRIAADLAAGDEVGRERVLACALRLLDRGFFRIGGEDYAEQNESYGLATMKRAHVQISDGEVVFDYPAKGGQRRVQGIADREVIPVIQRLKRRRGGSPELLAFKRRGRWADVRSEDVNSYLKEAAGGEYSAKDFRTWNATVLAAVALGSAGSTAETKSGRRRAENDAVEGVAAFLGNTPAVCRQSYIDPRVIDRYRDGETIERALRGVSLPDDVYDPKVQRSIERAVMRLIAD